MSKSVLVLFAVVGLVAGCVTVTGPSALPTTSATPAVTTPPPTAATPSSGPTATAAPSATAAPTGSAAPSASSGPTPQPSGDLGFDQRDVLFIDDLTDPTRQCAAPPPNTSLPDCWGVGTTDGGSVAYASGSLQFDTTSAGAWIWSRRLADSTSATMRIAGDFMPTGEGRFGLMCASGDTQLYGILVGTDGSWAFVSIGDNGAEVLLDDSAAGLITGSGVSTTMALECAGLSTGTLRLSLWLPEDGLVATYEAADGPDNFDRAAAYVEADGTGFSVAIDRVIAFGSGIGDGSYSPEGLALLAHVPTDWQPKCYQGLRPPYLASTSETVLTCFLGAAGTDGAEIAEYSSYLNADDMNAAYQGRVDNFATGAGADRCNTGPGEHSYNFGEGTPDVGRLLCVNQFSGIRFDWTDTRLNILSTLVDFDGNYASTYLDWIDGGPNL